MPILTIKSIKVPGTKTEDHLRIKKGLSNIINMYTSMDYLQSIQSVVEEMILEL
jgi:hypothetical protein